jgi:hypothetical protein
VLLYYWARARGDIGNRNLKEVNRGMNSLEHGDFPFAAMSDCERQKTRGNE